MQIVLLILINIAMFTVFYLIIRFKLESSVPAYREKRFRGEVDKIISEFNGLPPKYIKPVQPERSQQDARHTTQ